MNTTKYKVAWDEITKACRYIANNITKSTNEKFDYILSLGRGGLIPARLLSTYLKVPHIRILDVTAYNSNDELDKVKIIDSDISELNGKNILLIDDVYCTGATINAVINHLSNKLDEFKLSTAVLYCNKNILDGAQFIYSVYDTNDIWIVFPWEIE